MSLLPSSRTIGSAPCEERPFLCTVHLARPTVSEWADCDALRGAVVEQPAPRTLITRTSPALAPSNENVRFSFHPGRP